MARSGRVTHATLLAPAAPQHSSVLENPIVTVMAYEKWAEAQLERGTRYYETDFGVGWCRSDRPSTMVR